jgi:DNA repair exonuclease SbcCD ATPase subunit
LFDRLAERYGKDRVFRDIEAIEADAKFDEEIAERIGVHPARRHAFGVAGTAGALRESLRALTRLRRTESDRVRCLFLAVAVLLALWPALGLADPKTETEIKELESALNRLNQEQQSVYQQFQMVQELRRAQAAGTEQGGSPNYGMAAPPPIDYEVQQQQLQQRENRLRDLSDELGRLYAEYRALGEKKRTLLDRLDELTKTP